MFFKPTFRSYADKVYSYIDKLKIDSIALWFSTKHPETSLLLKIFIWLVVAYALSPIDLIPDFIPVLGLLDDLVLLAISVSFAVKLIPVKVIGRCRALAQQWFDKQKKQPTIYYGAFIVIGIWVILISLIYEFYFKL
tara:strand:- start:37 stop:447 length:411 start_codon:yes stop_codon:yes gene_type:complete